MQLEASCLPLNGANCYTWKSSSEKLATVDENGLVTLIGDTGKNVTITATAADGSGKKVSVKIVIENNIRSISAEG